MLNVTMGSALVALVAAACWYDLTARRIPNWLTTSGLLLGLGLSGVMGLDALGRALATAAVTFFVALPLFAAGGLGGGDVKFLAAVAAFMTPLLVLKTVVLSALAGGVLAIAVATRRGVVIPLFLDAGQLAVNLATFGRRGERRSLADPGVVFPAIPYAPAIGIGALAAWFL